MPKIVSAYQRPPIKTAWPMSQIHSKLKGNIIYPPARSCLTWQAGLLCFMLGPALIPVLTQPEMQPPSLLRPKVRLDSAPAHWEIPADSDMK